MKSYKYIGLILLFLLTSCASPIKNLYEPNSYDNIKTIYVVSHGWHTGIVISSSDIKGGMIPEKLDFSGDKYIEFGWGDEGFYQAPEITFNLALKAMFVPTDTVMHVVGFSNPVIESFPESEIVMLKISEVGLNKVITMIHNSFDREGNNKASSNMNGLYGNSKFYKAKGHYHIFKTCNNWTAKILRSSGFPISDLISGASGSVFTQIYRRGEILRMFKRESIWKKDYFRKKN